MHERPRFQAIEMDDVKAVACPCGQSRRAFADVPDGVATMHRVDISADARVHYHKKMTEIYYVLAGEGHMELDGQRVPLRPGSTVMIHPGCRHRAVGKLQIINVAVPAFDESDEWFD